MKPSKKVTLKDLAEKTGYSINTVSRALRDKSDIGWETREKIKETARSMGYINNTIASSLRLGYTNTIAVLLGDVSNPHFSIMMKEIENHARNMGYSSFLLNTGENSAIERSAILTAINKNVDGIIICPVQESSENIRFLKDSGVPFIQIGRHTDGVDASYVICDDEQGGYQAASYLLEMGHKKILFLNGPSHISSAVERRRGFERALAEHGLTPEPGLIREVSVSDLNVSEVMDSVVGKIGFTAIFAFSDSIAWAAWTWLHAHGYSVPGDFSLVGFDHIQSRMQIPFGLATISTYKGKMSGEAVDCLLKIIGRDAEKNPGQERIFRRVIHTRLVPGETVRRID